MRAKLLQKKSHQEWSWVLIIGFFIFGVVHPLFGFLGLLCMTLPFFHTIKGYGKLHCSHYCPRGSFFGRFLERFSLNKPLPMFMRTKTFKNLVLIAMISVFSFSLWHSGGNISKIGFAVFRLMLASTLVGLIMGVLSKPRSWCQICPMGHGTAMLSKITQKENNTNV